MKIYGRLSSLNVQKVIWCLGELGRLPGRDYERIDAGLDYGINNTPAYLEMNPTGLVPTLVDGDFVLWESNAIVRYLASVHGQGSLMPSDPRVRADSDRWMDWSLGTLWPTLRTAFIGLTRTPEPQRNAMQIKSAYDQSTRMLATLDAALSTRPFCAAAELTVGDIALGVAVHRWVLLATKFPDQLGTPPEFPCLLAWYRRITERPAFAATLP